MFNTRSRLFPSPTLSACAAGHDPCPVPRRAWAWLPLLAVAGMQPADAAFTSVASLPGVSSGAVAWGDYDNDGDLDILLTGQAAAGRTASIYRNDGGGAFTSVVTLHGVHSSAVAWGDYDNDGDLDILLTGNGMYSSKKAIVYRNDGGDTFTSAATLPGIVSGSVAWGDYDNDGDLDILLTGGPGAYHYYGHVYRNDGSDIFTSAASLIGVRYGSAAWGDYDSDGDLDVLITGVSSGYQARAFVYNNDGAGGFSPAVTLPGVYYSAVAWGDYDNDGDLDILLTGYGGGNKAIVYRNDGGNTFTSVATLAGVRTGAVAWGDYDNDGDLDILLTGYAGSGVSRGIVYRNDGGNAFTSAVTLQPVRSGAVAWGDYDNDGDLDILLTGSAGWASYIAILYSNDASDTTPNTLPSAPTGLTSSPGSDALLLQWNAASDGETPSAGLSYTLCVGTVSGDCDVTRPMADTGSGTRALAAMGPIQGTAWTLHGLLGGTTYYWRVQAIDSALAGSLLSVEQSFLVPVPAPSGLTATAASTTAMNLSWTDNSDKETGYAIERRIGAAAWSQIATTAANATAYVDSSLASGTTYDYRVRAMIGGEAASDYSNVASAMTQMVAAPPSGLGATPVSTSRIDLNWTDNSNNETGFAIERRFGGGVWSKIANVGANVTAYINNALKNGVTYYYRVRAVVSGQGTSTYSNEASATTFAAVAPSSLGAVAISASSVDLDWTDNSNNETGFAIERKTGSSGTWSKIANVGANVTHYASTGLKGGTSYYYRVRAVVSGVGSSAYSNEASVTTPVANPPSGLAAHAISSSRIDLSWTDNSGNETGFAIERKTGISGTWSKIANVGANVTSYASTGLKSGKTYYYRVRAVVSGVGASAYSNEADATTP